jgi:hypothetical protein
MAQEESTLFGLQPCGLALSVGSSLSFDDLMGLIRFLKFILHLMSHRYLIDFGPRCRISPSRALSCLPGEVNKSDAQQATWMVSGVYDPCISCLILRYQQIAQWEYSIHETRLLSSLSMSQDHSIVACCS